MSSTWSDPSAVPVPAPFAHLRRFPLDGALLLFDRDTGTNVRCEGEETAHLRARAPRALQFGITNRCNLACTFCSRDLDAKSDWTADSAFDLLSGLADAGVLEVAFGGGEPWAFPHFETLVARLYDETPLAVSFTTNGLALTPKRLAAVRGRYGQIRVSLYDDNAWRGTVGRLADAGARFGVNYLVTPERLPSLEAVVLELVALGCRDVLLLSYNGHDRALHLDAAQARDLSRRVAVLARALGSRCQLKLDVCWGERLEGVPRLFDKQDCGAGREFLVITSDRKVMPCSFHHLAFPVTSARDVMDVWHGQRAQLASASTLPGCARTPGHGLSSLSGAAS
ncbi:radical SAM/SPASM domain-containing protein [Corallococcus llansteffanensis]|uniref:radical SAM/SPASM domain-containing protein n=1 Tax=Corallococcus llansteffanensis TaxID=2316731 RepID=UPI0013155B88|nr:radical SAM protein [Corallococcus llansteffanensis]